MVVLLCGSSQRSGQLEALRFGIDQLEGQNQDHLTTSDKPYLTE